MSILQTEPAEQHNSKILPVKIKIGFFSIVSNILLLCFFFLQELTFSVAVYTHTLTQTGSQSQLAVAGAVLPPPPHTQTSVARPLQPFTAGLTSDSVCWYMVGIEGPRPN